MFRFEKIRTMNIDELAELFYKYRRCSECTVQTPFCIFKRKDCLRNHKQWLLEEVE